uniref:Ig-like domain-containing protein n=1 Tax=Romanomermis culicivorax TaxID=13658 RepID=A0A915JD49_ROMCU
MHKTSLPFNILNQYADFDSEPKEKCAPFFTVQPRRVQTYENEPARFECAVQGNPKPKVSWFINDQMAVNGSRYKLSYDGMHYLVVPHVQPQDAGEIVCVAKNSEGESRITVTLDVFVVHDFRFHKLRTMDDSNRSLDAQMQREYTWRREAMGVLGDVFDKGPKADYHKIMRAENARPTIASLESDELLRKFDRKKESAFYDNISSQSVSGQADKAPSWQNQLSNKPIMTEKQEQQKFKIRPPVVKAEDVPAKDQVQLKTVKPKGPEQETHVVLERAPQKTGDQWNVAQKVSEPEQKEQIQLKPAFQPKIVAGEQVQVKMEQVHLKDTPLDDKKERPHDEVPVVKTTILMKSSKKQPSLIQGLSSQTVEVGKPCLFTCKFDGDQPIDVLWSKDGRILGSTFEYQIKTIADESKLEISKVKHSHRGQYCVKIGNMAGSIDSNAYLTVIDKHDDSIVPKFVSILKDQYDAASGDKMSLSVQVIGRPQVLWFKDGKQLMREPRYDFLIQGDRHELIICDVLPQDSGIYECIVRNVKGEDRCRTNVKVYMSKSTPKLKIQVDESKQASKVLPSPEVKSYAPAPAFVEQLKPQHVQEGQTAKFSAKLNVPATAIKWCFDDRELKPNKFRLVATHTCENLSLEIRNISKKDEGKYTCEVTNESGTASSTANLQVLAKGTQLVTPTFAQGVHQSIQAPSFTKPLQSQTAKLGGKVELICGISGSPLPTIKWSVNDREIVFDNNVKAQTNVSEARLIIERVGSQHFGQYKCSIANKSGLAECSADLKQDSSSTRTAPPWLTRK